MKDYKTLEDLVSSTIKTYEEGFNSFNEEQEIRFNLTCTSHHVEVESMKAWVAYLRLERMIRPKGGKDEEWEHLLIYAQSYKFKNMGERADPKAPWKYDLYLDLFQRLVAGGLEYGELLKRIQTMSNGKKGKPISSIITPDEEEKKIIITDQIPAPLSEDDKQYLEWVKKNTQFGS